jgi:Tfp pilus assembly protein PilO
MELDSKQKVIGLAAVSGVVLAAVYLFLYAPVLKDLKVRAHEAREIEEKTRIARADLKQLDRSKDHAVLIPASGIASAIEEITSRGKQQGLRFLSIEPGEPQPLKDTKHNFMSIRMMIECGYDTFGGFVGSLEDLDRNLVKVHSFQMTSNQKDISRPRAELILHLYLE